jgi:hypothetical protein
MTRPRRMTGHFVIVAEGEVMRRSRVIHADALRKRQLQAASSGSW